MTDRTTVRMVVVILGTALLLALAFAGALALLDMQIPDSIDRVMFAALGAVGALLASTRSGQEDQGNG